MILAQNWSKTAKSLKLNGDKSELLVISSQYRPRSLLSSLTIGCSGVQSLASARNLGVVFDNGLTFEKHISADIRKLAFYHLRRIAKIRSYLSEESTIGLIHSPPEYTFGVWGQIGVDLSSSKNSKMSIWSELWTRSLSNATKNVNYHHSFPEYLKEMFTLRQSEWLQKNENFITM